MGAEILGYFTALGLSTAAGLNAYLPILALGLFSRYSDLIELPSPWDRLEDPVVLAVVAGVGVLDFVGDKVPAVDHVLHAFGMVIAPAAGLLVALASANAVDIDPAVAGVIGITAALATQVGRSAARPISTASTAGAGNPLLSIGEDGLSGLLSFTAIVLPLVAFAIVTLLVVGFVAVVRRWRAAGRGLDGRRPNP